MIRLSQVVRALARYMYWLAGAALAAIVFLTVADVALRLFARPIVGTYELVGFLGAWAIGLAIPQTSLDRGQVFMEFLVEKVGPRLKLVLESTTRLLAMLFFAVVSYNLFAMGDDLRAGGEVSLTLHLPQYPIAYGLAAACLVECLVLIVDLSKKRSAAS